MLENYLDNSATTRVCPEAAQAALSVMTDIYGNPSAVHSSGVKAKNVLENSRRTLADALSVDASEIYFSHSGTLANNTAIFGAAALRRKMGNRIITTKLEHPSVMRCMDSLEEQGFQIVRLSPGKNGAFEPEELLNAINKNTILVSVMLVNNEIGAINPVELISRAVKRVSAPALIHVDAIQAFGKMKVKPSKTGIDLLTVSGHKIHAPKGVGALYVRKGLGIKPTVLGGGQEGNLFSGTEALPAIAGFAEAVKALPDISRQYETTKNLRDYTLSMLKDIPQVVINSPSDALPNIINMSVMGIPSQVLINYLSERGIYISAGSACKKGHRSDVLTAIGLPPKVIDSAVRVSFSRYTTKEEAEIFVSAIKDAVNNIRTKI
ncbi:MAG: cysteine desulfurase [Ruminococcaceae bacterium]|nr:cysteine desulfurase [Oscillospiraceae bacterium]